MPLVNILDSKIKADEKGIAPDHRLLESHTKGICDETPNDRI